MPLPLNIDDLIRLRKVERTRIEYKEDWNPEPILHTITAFANDYDNMGGGYILIGIKEENGRPVIPVKGLEPDALDDIQREVLNKCNLIEPRYIPVIEPYTFEGKEILVLWAPGGDDRPYTCPEKVYTEKGAQKSNRSYYIRKGANTLKANQKEVHELISLHRDVPFDDRINYSADVTDMRPALFSQFLQEVGSNLASSVFDRPVEDIAVDMKVARGPVEYLKPVNVGLMFFTEDPEEYFPYSHIEVVDKPEPTGRGMTEKIFTGPLDKQLRDALAYIKNYIIAEYVTKVPDSELAIRAFNWPYAAVEEALSNAVYHKSYQIHEPITVMVTPEKMEIISVPGPDWSISDENLKDRILVSRRNRNRRIGDYLKELEIVEGRNTGVPTILEAMENNGSGLPSFETDRERSYFVTILPVHPLFLNKQGKKMQDSVNTNIVEKQGKRRSREEIKSLVVDLLNTKGDLSANEISALLGYKKLSDTLRSVIQELIEAGKIEYSCQDRIKSRKQKLHMVGR